MYTWNEHTSNGKLIGYQIIMGVGLGSYFQLLMLGVQAEFSDKVALMPNVSGRLLPSGKDSDGCYSSGCGVPIICAIDRCCSRRRYHQHREPSPTFIKLMTLNQSV